MRERTTAEDRLHRLLHVLAAAARGEGTPLRTLAHELGISEREVLRDLGEATDATFYRPAGSVDPFTITIEAGESGDVVHVHTTGDFRRPMRLTPRESLALVLGLRAMAAELPADDRDAMLQLARRMEAELGSAIHPEHTPLAGEPAGAEPGLDVDAVLEDATSQRCCCVIRYMKPGSEPEDRIIEPWRLVHAEGRWYVLARDTGIGEMRLFRCDRVLDARMLEDETFTVPDDFDPSDHMRRGVPFVGRAPECVTVRYDPPAARWVAEAEGRDPEPDGSVIVAHDVADRDWLVRRVFSFAGAAVVIEPAEVRAEIADRAARLADRLN